MAILVVADHDGNTISHHTARCLRAALAFGSDISLLVAGYQMASVAESARRLQGVKEVILADDERLAHLLPEALAAVILAQAASFSAILAPATALGKSVLPRVAAKLDLAQVSEIVSVESPTRFKRLSYAGNVLETVESLDPVQIVTTRTTAFEPVATSDEEAGIRQAAAFTFTPRSRHLSECRTQSERPDLSSARIVVAGGRGLGSAGNFQSLIASFSDKLGAAIGASRAAVDAGYAPNDWQIGQTGKVVAPELYLAFGISGAIQHLAGMKDSKTIIAVNKDPEAPIFDIADYGYVGDLFDVIPQLAS